MKKYNIYLTEKERALFIAILRRSRVLFSVNNQDGYISFLTDTATCKKVLTDLRNTAKIQLISEV